MFELIKKIFIGLLTGIVSASNHTKCVSLCNQKCMIQHTVINLQPNKYSQDFHYYPFAGKLDRCVENTNKVCVLNRTEDLNLSVFNMITGINESKTLTSKTLCKCKCKGRKCNSDQWSNNDKCQCECKKRHVCEKDYVSNPAT